MVSVGDDKRDEVTPSGPDDPPYQALLPNLDKMSADSFRKGSISRKRVDRSLIILAAVVIIIGITIAYSVFSGR